MKLLDEVIRDFDFSQPRVVVSGMTVILENVTEIVMISEQALTVGSGGRDRRKYTTVTGEDFVIREIGEGRLVIEGKIRGVEFLQAES